MTPNDQAAVAAVLYDAYHGTIDDEGDTREESLIEVRETMAGQYGPPVERACLVGVDEDDRIVAAVITVIFDGEPLLAYVVTDPDHQHQGWATALMEQALQEVVEQGGTRANLAVIVGNPAEALYEQLGFIRFDDLETP